MDTQIISLSNQKGVVGKTTTCANLGIGLAREGKRVLLVDTDMRRRCIGTMLNIHPRYGLYSVLAGSAQLQSAITPTKKPGLFFMDSEPNIPSPPDVLSTKRFAALVDQLRGMFDYVIFDTPPVGVFVDAAIISNLVDGTVYAIRERGEKRDNIVAGVQQLKAANARILGTVITFSQGRVAERLLLRLLQRRGQARFQTREGRARCRRTCRCARHCCR